jgi:hypothetical protein
VTRNLIVIVVGNKDILVAMSSEGVDKLAEGVEVATASIREVFEEGERVVIESSEYDTLPCSFPYVGTLTIDPNAKDIDINTVFRNALFHYSLASWTTQGIPELELTTTWTALQSVLHSFLLFRRQCPRSLVSNQLSIDSISDIIPSNNRRILIAIEESHIRESRVVGVILIQRELRTT